MVLVDPLDHPNLVTDDPLEYPVVLVVRRVRLIPVDRDPLEFPAVLVVQQVRLNLVGHDHLVCLEVLEDLLHQLGP